MSVEVKRPRGRPRKIASGSVGVPTPHFSSGELKLNRQQQRVVEAIARETRFSPLTVLDDVIKHGVLQVRGMYEDVVICRKNLDERFRPAERPLPQTADNGALRAGSTLAEFDSGLGPLDNDADLQRGHEADGEAPLDAVSSDDIVLT